MGFLGGLFGGQTGEEKKFGRFVNAGFDDPLKQKYMPGYLQSGNIGKYMSGGIAGIGQLMMNPGGLGANVSQAIAPRLAMESEAIAKNYQGLGANQAGAAARSNLPPSIKAALQAALGMNQVRDQRDARRGALMDSESLRRSDLENVYRMLDQILGFANSGMGMAQQGLGQNAQNSAQRQAATQAMMGGLASSAAMMSNSRFKEDIEPVEADKILDAIKTLPVYEWRYIGDSERHIGPLAEDFHEKFGLGDGPDTIKYVDAIGTLMAATQALAKRVERMEVRG